MSITRRARLCGGPTHIHNRALKKMGINWHCIVLTVPSLSVTGKTWRASLNVRNRHVLSLYI